MDVSIILPCRNEADALPHVLDEARETFDDIEQEYEIIVSDSSIDDSPQIAKDNGAHVVKHDTVGYGRAIKEGIKEATGDRLLIADADHTYDFNDAPRLLENEADLVIGIRNVTRENMSTHHRIGNYLLSTAGNLLFGTDVHDWHCGMRVVNTDTFKQLNCQTDGMEFASEMIIKATRHDTEIGEEPIRYRPRIGESTLDSVNDGWKHLRFLVLNAPERTMYPLAAALLIATAVLDSFAYKLTALLAAFQFATVGLYSEIYLHNVLNDKRTHISLLYDHLDLKRGLLLGLLLGITGAFLLNTFTKIAALLLGLQTITTVFYTSVLGIR